MVDKKIVLQYLDLQKEIKYLSEKIEKLTNEKLECESKKKRDSVKASSVEFPYVSHMVRIEGLTCASDMKRINQINQECKKLEERYDNVLKARNEILDFINSVDDSFMRMVITYRVIEGYSWAKVAMKIGGGNTSDGVRMAFKRFRER